MTDKIKLNDQEIRSFRSTVYDYYHSHGRNLPWRNINDPYKILVSEIMLQQTQVSRVIEKFPQFIDVFPDIQSLDRATLTEVLEVWQGLGYNRRVLTLKKTARMVMKDFNGIIPSSYDDLLSLPGIGRSTAAAILAFAFNISFPFIETNIRSVFIHFFFHESTNIRDSEILPLVEQTLDKNDPRNWYYALMDYGVMLKTRLPNPGARSAHYMKQSPFKNSDREIRGKILRILTRKPDIPESKLIDEMAAEPGRVKKILFQLEKEGFIKRINGLLLIRDTPV